MIAQFPIPDETDIALHADRISRDACLIFTAALTVSDELALQLLASFTARIRSETERAIIEAWTAACETAADALRDQVAS